MQRDGEPGVLAGDTVELNSLAPVESRQVGNECLDHEDAAAAQAGSHVAKATNLLSLGDQGKERVNDDIHQAERPPSALTSAKFPMLTAIWLPPDLLIRRIPLVVHGGYALAVLGRVRACTLTRWLVHRASVPGSSPAAHVI